MKKRVVIFLSMLMAVGLLAGCGGYAIYAAGAAAVGAGKIRTGKLYLLGNRKTGPADGKSTGAAFATCAGFLCHSMKIALEEGNYAK